MNKCIYNFGYKNQTLSFSLFPPFSFYPFWYVVFPPYEPCSEAAAVLVTSPAAVAAPVAVAPREAEAEAEAEAGSGKIPTAWYG